jgi:hypothetical protein
LESEKEEFENFQAEAGEDKSAEKVILNLLAVPKHKLEAEKTVTAVNE